jgi:hypothetical protein
MQTFKPTTASGSWREREHERSRQRKENERIAIENERKKQFEVTDTNFPTMISSPESSQKTFVSGSAFATKAREWKEQEDAAKLLEEQKKAVRNKEEAERKSVFIFRKKVPYVNEATEIPYEEDDKQTDEWTTVAKKVSRPKKNALSELEIMQKIDESYAENERGGSEDEYNPTQSYGTRDYY